MGIARLHRKRHNFSIIDNQAAEDKSLSWKARGILWYLLTKPDFWKVRISDLIAQSDKDGRDSVRSGFKELESSGYAVRNKVRNEQGQFEWITEVFETKEDAAEWLKRSDSKDSCQSGKPVDGLPVGGKPVDISNTDSGITDLEITNLNHSDNQRYKDFSGKSDSHDFQSDLEELNHTNNEKDDRTLSGNVDSKSTKSQSKETDRSTSSGVGKSERLKDSSPGFSLKKEKQVALKYDEWGVLQLPKTPKYTLPSLLATRTMQFLVAEKCLGCTFGLEGDGTVWIYDSYQGEAQTEEAAFGKDGTLPLKKLIALSNSEQTDLEEMLDLEWYNEQIRYFFGEWRKWCEAQGKNATKITKSKSVALLVKDLVQFDEDFFDEFEFETVA